MKTAYNKISISKDLEKLIRGMFFKQIEMTKICSNVGLKESVIRRVVKEKNWYKGRERYLRYLCYLAYAQGATITDISKRASVAYSVLTRIKRKYAIKLAKRKAWNKRVTEQMENQFIKDYIGGQSSHHIARQYGFKRRETVLNILKKNNVERREAKIVTHYIEDFFELIDSPEKAYILGLIMTDGYIVKDYSGFGIQLTQEDGYILEKIGKLIGSTNRILSIDCTNKRKVLPNAKDMNRLTITNKKIALDLKNLGVTKQKSKTLRYLGCVPPKHMPHFFRGLIDGDGTIGTAKNGNVWCQLVSASKDFLVDLNLFLLLLQPSFNLRIGRCITTRFDKRHAIYVLRVNGGNKETIRFLRWMYGDKGDLYLRRKYAKVQNYID